MPNKPSYESGMVLPTELRIGEFWLGVAIIFAVVLLGDVDTGSLVAGAIGLGLTTDGMLDGVALNRFLQINPRG